jgi:hypothetical protein
VAKSDISKADRRDARKSLERAAAEVKRRRRLRLWLGVVLIAGLFSAVLVLGLFRGPGP